MHPDIRQIQAVVEAEADSATAPGLAAKDRTTAATVGLVGMGYWVESEAGWGLERVATVAPAGVMQVAVEVEGDTVVAAPLVELAAVAAPLAFWKGRTRWS